MKKSHLIYKIKLLIIISCLNGYSQVSFEEQASLLGIEISYGLGEFGGGVSFCDYNNDGWDDITVSSEEGKPIMFYKNVNGSFVEDNINISDDNYETKQVQWVDVDNDGDKDFFVTSSTNANKLYENDGNFNFTDITISSGLDLPATNSWGSSWGDYNNDGYLDVFICFRKFGDTQTNALFKNNGDNTFINVSLDAGLNQIFDPTFCAAFFDYNNDGWQDIYVTNHKFSQSYLYKNNGNGSFTDISAISGTDVITDGMSTTIGDYNNDGWFDIYITNLGNSNSNVNVLLKNNGNETFTEVAVATGTEFNSVAWGAVFLDAENDGDLDLYVSGMLDGSTSLPSAFYENQGDNTFNIPSDIGLNNDTAQSFSNVIGDVDNDGYPEIYVVNENSNNYLWKNTSISTNNWLKVKLEGTQSNRDGIGSIIEIKANGQKQFRYTLNGEGYIGQNSNTEFFGIGTATDIDYVKVTWLSGIVDLYENITPNQTLSIVEGQVLNIDEFSILDIQLYPNPVNDKLQVKINNGLSDYINIELYTNLGKKIFSNIFNSNSIELDVTNLSSGIYFLRFIGDEEIVAKKIIVK